MTSSITAMQNQVAVAKPDTVVKKIRSIAMTQRMRPRRGGGGKGITLPYINPINKPKQTEYIR